MKWIQVVSSDGHKLTSTRPGKARILVRRGKAKWITDQAIQLTNDKL